MGINTYLNPSKSPMKIYTKSELKVFLSLSVNHLMVVMKALCYYQNFVPWVLFSPFAGAVYGKCPKISNIKVSDKMIYANCADPDQTVPAGAV